MIIFALFGNTQPQLMVNPLSPSETENNQQLLTQIYEILEDHTESVEHDFVYSDHQHTLLSPIVITVTQPLYIFKNCFKKDTFQTEVFIPPNIKISLS